MVKKLKIIRKSSHFRSFNVDFSVSNFLVDETRTILVIREKSIPKLFNKVVELSHLCVWVDMGHDSFACLSDNINVFKVSVFTLNQVLVVSL